MLLRYAVEGDTTAQRYKNTVISDSGTVQNAKLVQDIVKYYKNSGRWGNIRLMVAPSAGINIRDSSPYKYTSKLYSFDRIPNNVAQSTAGLQPYLSGFIAPNEKYAILNPNGGSKIMSHNAMLLRSEQYVILVFGHRIGERYVDVEMLDVGKAALGYVGGREVVEPFLS